MKTRRLGRNGPEVSAIGLGCMGMSAFYGGWQDSTAESVRTLHRAIEIGVTFLDTAEIYGPHTNEELIGETFAGKRDQIFLATKFGIGVTGEGAARTTFMQGKPADARKALEGSLKRLRTDRVDLYYLHRVDPNTPIEETMGGLMDLRREGKLLHIGLSEASAETLRRACAVGPVTALQSEYSLWTRDPENGVLAACRELGVGFVPYSPLGRGFLTGQIKSPDDFEPTDFRRFNPRFMGENFDKNLALVDAVSAIAAEKGVTPAQLALAWVLAQGDDMVPIPGTKRVKTLEENAAAVDIVLTADDLKRIEAVFPADAVAGTRYPEAGMRAVNR
ncbi:MAG: aldo/keto reductase [Caulobacteraceae bacterium]|nr:aldo/keto reductase [Caulobacteraceae bacterium]